MNSFLKSAAAIATAFVVATSAHATTFVYGLGDHPDGNKSDDYNYGLRLDREDPDRFFSFGPSVETIANPTLSRFSAYLIYDAFENTVTMRGEMTESLQSGGIGGTYTLTYTIRGVANIGALGSGHFRDSSGSGMGSLTNGTETFDLGADSRSDGAYFIFGTDSRSYSGITGEGWVGQLSGQDKPNDFLFTATFIGNTPPGQDDPTVTPLPAAGWMLLAGLGGIGLMRRRRKPS